jgi:hypothetical protein
MEAKRKHLIFWKLVERENAVRYLMISMISFVVTIGVVRTFLALSGYPQLGNGTLHIAHVMWGGLILYIAAVLPLVYLNPRLHFLGAVLSGVGMGLFLDEVGKFITRQYDYFFPAAAPIIYLFFLLIVILVVMIRRPDKMDGRAELVQALEIVREQLYRPLDGLEKSHLEADMNSVLQSDGDVLHQEMARQILDIVHSDPRTAKNLQPAWWTRLHGWQVSWLTAERLRWLLFAGMVILGLLSLKNPIQAGLNQVIPNSWLTAFLNSHTGRQILAQDAPLLYNTRLVLEVLVGVGFLTAAGLLAAGKKRAALTLGNVCLLVSLTVLDLLLFYFEQFSTVLVVIVQFLVLFDLLFYRRELLKLQP